MPSQVLLSVIRLLPADSQHQPGHVAADGAEGVVELIGIAHRLGQLLGDVDAVAVHAKGFVVQLMYRGGRGGDGAAHGRERAGGHPRPAEAAPQGLLKGDIFRFKVRRIRVGHIVEDHRLLCPLEVHGLFQHEHGVGN